MERRSIAVQGIVQGVGFRPFVYGLASRWKLGGFVMNRADGVLIEVEGKTRALDRFLLELTAQLPPLAHIDTMSCHRQSPRGDHEFHIERSETENGKATDQQNGTRNHAPIFVSPDMAICDDCLAELFNPSDRRYRYPFLNCTNCGPRLTIITGAPYDRDRTTMAGFTMCSACRAEYEDPTNRRFHAQPTACPACGPQLQLLNADGTPVQTSVPLASFAAAVRAGSIGALKGLGGFHLTCDARSDAAVTALRQRKQRDEKPFAVMLRSVEIAKTYCQVSAEEAALLTSPRRPIVLLQRRSNARIASGVAPGNPRLGVMLPYTPLHHLLLEAVGGIPLVMTSGNRSDEPIAFENADAVRRLRGIADLFLIHDRPIHVRCDDSVTRIVDRTESLVRRSRGYAPQPIALPLACPHPILAVGGQLKSTFALGRVRHAFLSHHLGDLDHYTAFRAFDQDLQLYQQLFNMEPVQIAHDLHPEYASTRYANAASSSFRSSQIGNHDGQSKSCNNGSLGAHGERRADLSLPCEGGARAGVRERESSQSHRKPETAETSKAAFDTQTRVASTRGQMVSAARACYPDQPPFLIPVQHHHAHMASCMAEHGLMEPVIGVTFDGTGFGTDGAIWGGEFLVGDYRAFLRAAHLRYVGMPGGDQAIREPWRMAVAHLRDAGKSAGELANRPPSAALRTIEAMLEKRLLTPMTSSAGRLFDAVAALAGVRQRVSFEGQAAMEMEWLATGVPQAGSYPFELAVMPDAKPAQPVVVDTRPLICAVAVDVARGTRAAIISRRFHTTIVELIASVCEQIRSSTQLNAVVLSGGVFMNALLSSETCVRLKDDGFRVYRHRLVPPNDGGLSLGQLVIAAALATR